MKTSAQGTLDRGALDGAIGPMVHRRRSIAKPRRKCKIVLARLSSWGAGTDFLTVLGGWIEVGGFGFGWWNGQHFGYFGIFRKESTMGKDSHNEMEKSMLSPETRQKFDELMALLAAERYGPNGPPMDTTFAEMEQFGHQTGRMVGRAIDEHLAEQQGDEHFQEASCPTCGASGKSNAARKTRPLQTLDGKIPIAEPAFHCPTCDRDFFPSAERPCD